MYGLLLKLFPGVLLSALIALIGIYSSRYIGENLLGLEKSPISPIILSIAIGLIIGNLTKLSDSFIPGVNFSMKFILRFGIVCLGIRLGILDIFEIGLLSIPLIVACLIISIIIVNLLAKILKIPPKMGALIAVGTSICGASAIIAASPSIRANKEEVTYAIANITIFGMIAMLLYPFLAHHLFSGNELAVGLFIGTSIHETAQVAGAGLIYAEHYGAPKAIDVATVVKLVRNTSMIVIIPAIGFLYLKSQNAIEEKHKVSIFSMVPIFILGFILMGLIRTIGDYGIKETQIALMMFNSSSWEQIIAVIKICAEFSLAIAMAAVGMSANIVSLKELGIKPFYVGFAAALCVGLVSYFGITLFNLNNL